MEAAKRRAWVEVDLGALRRNATALAARAAVPLLPMIKADAYGLGAVAVARALAPMGVWGFGVAAVAEAEELRTAGITERILLVSPSLPEEFPDVRRLAVTPAFGAPATLLQWIEGGGGTWHLSIDTGMNRAGVPWFQIGDIVDLVRSHPPEGAFTHFHSADRNDGSRQLQQERFREAVDALPMRPPLLHAENSPGIERQGPSAWDVARPGVFLYGVGGDEGAAVRPEPVVHLRARVVEIRDVFDGGTVSYGATWRASGTRRVATVSAGYADGYRRAFGNRGTALVHGRAAPVAGMVTMDMTMLDVTGVPCAVGDVATLLGRDGEALLDVNDVARVAELSPYELLVGLALRAPRIYTEGAS